MSVAVRVFAREDEQEAALSLASWLRKSYNAVRESRCDFSELHETVMQLEKFIFSVDKNEISARKIWDSINPEVVARLNEAYCFWESRLEHQFAQRLARGQVELADYFLHERFEMLVKRELSLIANSRLKRVLIVGSGVLPISALLVHAQTGAPVDCVARDPAAAEISRQVIERCRCSTSVRVLGERQAFLDLQDYDLILIELPFEAKKNILKGARKRCRTDCQILCRTSYGLRQLLYQSTQERDRRGFYVKAEQVAE